MSGNDNNNSSNKSKQPLIGGKSKQVWFGRPSVSVFYLLYGIVALVIVGILVGLELWAGSRFAAGRALLPKYVSFGGTTIEYPVELVTVLIVVAAYLIKVIQLAILRASHKYILREDGLYVDKGIFNLQNTFIAPMAFSDARLNLPIGLRLVRRGNIIVDANDNRHFQLLLIKDAVVVQDLIRRTLGHPVVRIESPSPP
jgi:hypothetical protein